MSTQQHSKGLDRKKISQVIDNVGEIEIVEVHQQQKQLQQSTSAANKSRRSKSLVQRRGILETRETAPPVIDLSDDEEGSPSNPPSISSRQSTVIAKDDAAEPDMGSRASTRLVDQLDAKRRLQEEIARLNSKVQEIDENLTNELKTMLACKATHDEDGDSDGRVADAHLAAVAGVSGSVKACDFARWSDNRKESVESTDDKGSAMRLPHGFLEDKVSNCLIPKMAIGSPGTKTFWSTDGQIPAEEVVCKPELMQFEEPDAPTEESMNIDEKYPELDPDESTYRTPPRMSHSNRPMFSESTPLSSPFKVPTPSMRTPKSFAKSPAAYSPYYDVATSTWNVARDDRKRVADKNGDLDELSSDFSDMSVSDSEYGGTSKQKLKTRLKVSSKKPAPAKTTDKHGGIETEKPKETRTEEAENNQDDVDKHWRPKIAAYHKVQERLRLKFMTEFMAKDEEYRKEYMREREQRLGIGKYEIPENFKMLNNRPKESQDKRVNDGKLDEDQPPNKKPKKSDGTSGAGSSSSSSGSRGAEHSYKGALETIVVKDGNEYRVGYWTPPERNILSHIYYHREDYYDKYDEVLAKCKPARQRHQNLASKNFMLVALVMRTSDYPRMPSSCDEVVRTIGSRYSYRQLLGKNSTSAQPIACLPVPEACYLYGCCALRKSKASGKNRSQQIKPRTCIDLDMPFDLEDYKPEELEWVDRKFNNVDPTLKSYD